MALIKCKECGKEISDSVRVCPKCGYRKKKEVSKKTLIISASIAGFVILLLATLFFITREKPLTELEEKTVEIVLDFESILKNTDSLQIHDIRYDDNELVKDGIFIYLDYSAQNGFGGNNRGIVRYFYSPEEEIQFQGTSQDDDSSWEELIAKNIIEGWGEIESDESKAISVERVMGVVNEK